MRLQKREEALAEFQRVVKEAPQNALAHANIAALMMQQRNLPKAITHLQLTLKANPNMTAAKLQLAHLLRAEGRTKEAIVHYEEILERQPGLKPAVDGLKSIRAQATDAKER